jgi:hypothetical protein
MKYRFKLWWHKLLVFLHIRKAYVWKDPVTLRNVGTYQQASLAMLLNLERHIKISNQKFKDFDRYKAEFGDGAIKFKKK